MPTAFVLINTETGLETDMLRRLRNIEGVDEAHVVYGAYDVMARVKAESLAMLNEIISLRIRKLDKVRSILSLVVLEKSNQTEAK